MGRTKTKFTLLPPKTLKDERHPPSELEMANAKPMYLSSRVFTIFAQGLLVPKPRIPYEKNVLRFSLSTDSSTNLRPNSYRPGGKLWRSVRSERYAVLDGTVLGIVAWTPIPGNRVAT
jgi:hypothetical protein